MPKSDLGESAMNDGQVEDDLSPEYDFTSLEGGVQGKDLGLASSHVEAASLTDKLLSGNPDFRALVERSKAGSRKPFPPE